MEEERFRYQRMSDFVKSLGEEWFLFKYEDMVSKKFNDLNKYLDFQIEEGAGIAQSTGKAKVVRKKGIGDWRYWFTEEDVELFKPAYLSYMELSDYDCNDWAVSKNPVIQPDYSSMYMKSLPRMAAIDVIRHYKKRWIKRLTK